MTETVFPSLREIGFKSAKPELDDWLWCCSFGPGLKDRANLQALEYFLRYKLGENAYQFLAEPGAEIGTVRAVHLIIEPTSEVSLLVWDTLEVIERDGILDEQIFDDLVGPIIQRLWESMTMQDRIVLVEEAQAPWGDVLEAEPSEPVQTLIYRTLDL